ncbi:uncharacterized protein [Taeniopygia guttata]|uniref:uncharacterized protein n=1 Tax=Taeniopygia guttata TaxID=59729 RepID=UPI003BB90DC2
MDPLLAKAEPISDSGSDPGIISELLPYPKVFSACRLMRPISRPAPRNYGSISGTVLSIADSRCGWGSGRLRARAEPSRAGRGSGAVAGRGSRRGAGSGDSSGAAAAALGLLPGARGACTRTTRRKASDPAALIDRHSPRTGRRERRPREGRRDGGTDPPRRAPHRQRRGRQGAPLPRGGGSAPAAARAARPSAGPGPRHRNHRGDYRGYHRNNHRNSHRGYRSRDIAEQKPEGASSHPPQPGEAVAKQSYPDNKPPRPNPHCSLAGSGQRCWRAHRSTMKTAPLQRSRSQAAGAGSSGRKELEPGGRAREERGTGDELLM